jgi:hypothetical protein
MGLFDSNWRGLGKTFARGAHTNDPSDPQYAKHWDVVPGSLSHPYEGKPIIGTYQPDEGSLRVSVPTNLRFSGEVAYIDRAVLPEPAIALLKPAGWAAKHASIEPVAVPRAELRVTTDGRGHRSVTIPAAYGGGTIVERPGAIPGRANDATPAEQIRSLKGFFSNPRWRR